MTKVQLERAEKIALAMEPAHMETWSMMWPMGHCGITCLALAPILRMALELDLHVVVGVVCVDTPSPSCRPHAWIESPEGDIIDPTWSQFTHGKSMTPALRSWPAYEISPHVPELVLSFDEEEFYRRSVKPYSGPHGWSANSGIKELFSDYPRVRKECPDAHRVHALA